MEFLKVLLLILSAGMMIASPVVARPHIIMIYADDLGWNDASFHGSPEIPTPNLDAFAMSGILLNSYYSQWHCTPSRAALLTGINSIRLGFQHSTNHVGEASVLPLNVATLPEYLRPLGYKSHMIGKWNLGYKTKEYTPTYRGFDSFFGYYNGKIDYYDHVAFGSTFLEKTPYFHGLDLHNNTDTVRNFQGRYATEMFTEIAEEKIRQHNVSEPLFMYLAHLAVNAANSYAPVQAPSRYVERVKHISNINRRIHAGMVTALDDSVGKVFKALHEKGILENSIIVFTSDNGGETDAIGEDGFGSNFPLRGKKNTVWEGGLRVPAVLWSPLLNLKKPRISKQLMHVTDWLPTLYAAAGGNPENIFDVDGINMWDTLINDTPSPRSEFLYNIDPVEGVSALQRLGWKVVNGTTGFDLWYNPTKNDCFNGRLSSKNCTFGLEGDVHSILMQTNRWICDNPSNWRKDAELRCSQPPPTYVDCNPDRKPCLFNVEEDPCEYHNLAETYPEVVDMLMDSINSYQKRAVTPQSQPSDPKANPQCHDFAFVPWLDPENYNECTSFS